MVLEFPPELPNLELSELSELPDLSNLPDLDSDLSSSKSNTSADLGSDLDLDALLSLDSDLNSSFGTDFEKEFGFPEDTTDNSMEDLLNQMQADVDFSELGILDELEGIEGLEDLVMPEFDQPNPNLQTEDNSQVSGNAILEKMGSGDFDDLLEDFSTVETVVAVSQISADASEQESDRAFDQMFESQDELTFDLPDLDDGFVSSVEADSEPTSEPVGEFIGSESIGFEDLDPFAETIETTSDSARQVEIPAANFELNAQNLEDLDVFSSFDSDSLDSFGSDSFGSDSFSSINDSTENSTEEILTEGNLIEETSNLGLPDLDSSLDNFLDDPLGNSNEDFSVVDALAIGETVVTTEEPVEDPFATSWEQSSLESLTELDLPKSQLDSESNSELSLEQKLESFDAFSSLNAFNAIDNLTEEVSDSGFDNSLDDSFSDSAEGSLLDLEADLAIVETLVVAIEEPEYTVTHQDLADELEDDLQNSSLQSSTTEESFTAILAADSWSVEESRRAVEEDPFSDTFSQSLEETFEGSPIIGFTTILSSETESLLAPAEEMDLETNLERRPELAIAPSLPTSEESFQEPLVTKSDLSTLVVEPPIVQETISEADLAEIEPLGLSYEQTVEPPIDDFTQILSSEQVGSSLEPIDTLTPDTLTLDTLTPDTLSSNDPASNASENPEPVQISQTDVRSNQLMGDVAVASAGVVSGVSTNSFAGSDRTGQPLQESLEQEMASEDSLNSESERNENVDPYAGDESQSPWLKIGLAVALVIALIGGFALVRSNNNNQPSQPTNQTNN